MSAAKQDRFAAPGAEETAVRDEELRRREEVEEAFRVRVREGFEVAEKFSTSAAGMIFSRMDFIPTPIRTLGAATAMAGRRSIGLLVVIGFVA